MTYIHDIHVYHDIYMIHTHQYCIMYLTIFANAPPPYCTRVYPTLTRVLVLHYVTHVTSHQRVSVLFDKISYFPNEIRYQYWYSSMWYCTWCWIPGQVSGTIAIPPSLNPKNPTAKWTAFKRTPPEHACCDVRTTVAWSWLSRIR